MGSGLFCLILGCVIAIVAFILDFKINDTPKTVVGMSILASASTAMAILGILVITTTSQPKAIDVYRNKTTLKVTYVDSVAVDSVVIFK